MKLSTWDIPREVSKILYTLPVQTANSADKFCVERKKRSSYDGPESVGFVKMCN